MTDEYEEINNLLSAAGVRVDISPVHVRPDGLMGDSNYHQIHHLFTIANDKGTHTGYFSAGIGCAKVQWEHKRNKGVPRATLPHTNPLPNPGTVAARDNEDVIARSYRPTRVDIIASLAIDYTLETFEDWCADLGYEETIVAKKTYDACRAETVALDHMFTISELETLLELAREL